MCREGEDEVFYGMLCNQKVFGLMLAERVETYKTRKFIQHVHVSENFSFVKAFHYMENEHCVYIYPYTQMYRCIPYTAVDCTLCTQNKSYKYHYSTFKLCGGEGRRWVDEGGTLCLAMLHFNFS